MRRIVVVLALLSWPSSAWATWSVVAVDRGTGRVVIASATCVNLDDQFLMGVQAVVVPGKGVAACQAAVDRTHGNQRLVFGELQKGTDPARIIEMLSQDPAFQTRQFGIVDLQGRSAGHSGLGNGPCRRTFRDGCTAPRSSIRFRATSCARGRWCPTPSRRSSARRER